MEYTDKVKGQKVCSACGLLPSDNTRMVEIQGTNKIVCNEACMDSYYEDS